jgi:hypothetical protein
MTTAILGCGPAGLLAAHAAIGLGEDVTIFSRKTKSWLNGAQYLHGSIPGLPSEDAEPVMLDYTLIGTADGYREKVYGKQWDGTVSPEEMLESHPAWNIRTDYDFLWDEYQDLIMDSDIHPRSLDLLGMQEHGMYDLIVSSIPAPALCSKGHTFASTEIWAAGDAPGMGISIPYKCPDNTVLCNGEPEPSWYRLSSLYGHKTVEWPGSMNRPPINGAAKVVKPTMNNCDCFPNVLRVGRYGTWQKGVLAHEAFTTTLLALMP